MGRSGTSGCCGARVEDFFREHEERPTLDSVVVGGVELEKGSRVLLWPGAGGDIMDLALKGKGAVVGGLGEGEGGRRVGGGGRERRPRVLLWPGAGGDIMDLALKGKVAFVEGIEQDYEGRVYIAVTLEDDPGRDLGEDRFLGHRFFFSSEEVEPLDLEPPHEA